MAGKRAVVVGAGGISRVWFPALAQERVQVSAVVDLDVAAARRALAQHHLDAEASSDLAAALKKHRPDFVVDITVPEAHCQVTCAALKAGYHVIGEKPMAASMAEARRMVQAAERTGRLYMVSQTRRWNVHHDQLRRSVTPAKIGPITAINCDFYLGAHFGGFRAKMESPLILDMAIHHFDLARYFTGADPVAVYAKEFNPAGSWYDGDAAASCIFEMTGGVIFTYRGSWAAQGCSTNWNGHWRIMGSKGTVLYRDGEAPHGQAVTPGPVRGLALPLKDVTIPAPRLKHEQWRGALREMLAYLRTGRRPQTECYDNVKSLAMVFAAMASSRKGRRVTIRTA